MTEQIQKQELTTPEQANDVLKAIGDITTFRGEDRRTKMVADGLPTVIPDVIAGYMLPLNTDYESPDVTLSVMQHKVDDSGKPVVVGPKGEVIFRKSGILASGGLRTSEIKYLVSLQPDGSNELERRVSVSDAHQGEPGTGSNRGEVDENQASGTVTADTLVTEPEARAILETLAPLTVYQ